MNSVERYDIGKNEWVELERLPGMRAGCVGFFVEEEEKIGFWVMGGYGEERTIGGVFPVDEYCRDAVVMQFNNSTGRGNWREVGDMWEQGEKVRVGKIVVVENHERSGHPGVFMLDGNHIFRFFFFLFPVQFLFIVKYFISITFSVFVSHFVNLAVARLLKYVW